MPSAEDLALLQKKAPLGFLRGRRRSDEVKWKKTQTPLLRLLFQPRVLITRAPEGSADCAPARNRGFWIGLMVSALPYVSNIPSTALVMIQLVISAHF